MMKAGETTPPRGQSFIASTPSGGNKLPLIQWQPWLKSILSPPCLSVADFRDYQTGRESVCDANSHQENIELTFPQCSCHSSPSYAVFVYPILLKNGTKTVKTICFLICSFWFDSSNILVTRRLAGSYQLISLLLMLPFFLAKAQPG